MRNEIKALEENEAWELTCIPSDWKAIRIKWVLRTKLGPTGENDQYQARLAFYVLAVVRNRLRRSVLPAGTVFHHPIPPGAGSKA